MDRSAGLDAAPLMFPAAVVTPNPGRVGNDYLTP
jgi:hypothetical protein